MTNTKNVRRTHAREGFAVNDRGGRVLVRSKGTGAGTVLVFRGNDRPKLVHV